MKILLIISSNEGTIASCAYQLYKGLLQEIPDIKLLVVCYGKYSKNGFSFGNCLKLNFLSKGKLSSLLVRTFLLRKIKRKYKIQISISTQTGPSVWNVLTGVKEYKIGIFHAILKQSLATSKLKYINFFILYNTILKFLNKKVGVSKKIVEDLRTNIGGNVQLCYNIHDVYGIREKSQYPILDENEARVFEKPVVLYVGGLFEKVKAPSRLLNAFAILKSKLKDDIHLVYIGRDIQDTLINLKELASLLGIEDSVHFLGPKANPYQYMKRAKILVSPSRDEGLPGVIIESLIVGTPCVATNSSLGNWEIMQCENSYDEDLNIIKETPMGCITPNFLHDDKLTEYMLCEGMYSTITRSDLDLSKFNYTRFMPREIIKRIIS